MKLKQFLTALSILPTFLFSQEVKIQLKKDNILLNEIAVGKFEKKDGWITLSDLQNQPILIGKFETEKLQYGIKNDYFILKNPKNEKVKEFNPQYYESTLNFAKLLVQNLLRNTDVQLMNSNGFDNAKISAFFEDTKKRELPQEIVAQIEGEKKYRDLNFYLDASKNEVFIGGQGGTLVGYYYDTNFIKTPNFMYKNFGNFYSGVEPRIVFTNLEKTPLAMYFYDYFSKYLLYSNGKKEKIDSPSENYNEILKKLAYYGLYK